MSGHESAHSASKGRPCWRCGLTAEGSTMPLLDHFHPPLSVGRSWQTLHAAFASALAIVLNQALGEGYTAVDFSSDGPVLDLEASVFDAPTAPGLAPPLTLPVGFADDFGVEVMTTDGTRRVIAAVELVTPRQKTSPEARRGFAAKCASRIYRGQGLILVDLVTNARANLHNDVVQTLGASASFQMSQNALLYAAAYRPARRRAREEIDLWAVPLTLGESLPTLPLGMGGEHGVMLDLEGAYMDFWRRRKSFH